MAVENGPDDTPAGRWRPAIDALAAGLATHLGEQVTVVNVTEMEDAFSCLVRGPEPSGSTLQVAWEGVLGMEHFEAKPNVSATLFLYSRGRRLWLDDQRGSYLEIVYDGPLDGSGTWRDLGWLQDDAHPGVDPTADQFYGDLLAEQPNDRLPDRRGRPVDDEAQHETDRHCQPLLAASSPALDPSGL